MRLVWKEMKMVVGQVSLRLCCQLTPDDYYN